MTLEKLGPSKIPPVIVIAGPQDGMGVDFEYISIAGVAESEKGSPNSRSWLTSSRPVGKKEGTCSWLPRT